MRKSHLLRIAYHFIAARWRWQTLRGEALTRYQDERAQRITAFTNKHSPFYGAHWAGHDIRQWRDLPTVNKQTMMTNLDTFNTLRIKSDEALAVALQAERERNFSPTINGTTVGLSSGTSGHRGLFLISPSEQSGWAGVILSRTLHRLRPGGEQVAFFLRSNSNLYESVDSRLIRFRYFDLMMPLKDAVIALNDYQPSIIVGPPSLLGFLAEAKERSELRATPERLISVAEVLEPHDQARLESVFQVPVHQIYQCTEGLLAVSCSAGSLHIQEDMIVMQFEPVQEAVTLTMTDNFSPTRVTPIITDLWRTTQPMIRYRLNDILQLQTTPCKCGSDFRIIKAIEGRSDDVCYFETHEGNRRPFFPDTIRRMILLASDAIEDYQAFQDRTGQIRIHLVAADSFGAAAHAVRASVDSTLAQYGCQADEVVIAEGLVSVPTGVKRRRVQKIG